MSDFDTDLQHHKKATDKQIGGNHYKGFTYLQ